MSEERIKDFHNKHGSFVTVPGTSLLVFSDGASRENSNYGVLREPPENDFERWKIIAQYWEIKLELSIEEFDYKKRNYLTAAQYALKEPRPAGLPCEQDEAIDELKELKKKVSNSQKKLDEAKTAVEKYKPKNKNLQADIYEQNRERLGNFISALSQIEI